MKQINILQADRERAQQLFDAGFSKDKQKPQAKVGFIAEAIFERLYPDAYLVTGKQDKQDAGFDFVLNGRTVDVKARTPYERLGVLYFGLDYRRMATNVNTPEYYACFSVEGDVATWWGFVEHGQKANNIKSGYYYNYTDKEFRSWISYKS